jgi:hypothetical protein
VVALAIQPTHIAYTYASCVLPLAVAAYIVEVSTKLYGAIELYDIVVSYVTPSVTLYVPATYLRRVDIDTFAGG